MANHYLVNQKGISPSDMIAKMVDEHFRISCFSSKDVLQCEEILMWSHYANKHQGMRIKFSLNDMRTYPYYIKRIRYEKERIELDLASDKWGNSEALMDICRMKAEGWHYEKEYRMFVSPRDCVHESDQDGVTRSFMPFAREIIKGIDFGIRCPQLEMNKIVALCKKEYPGVELRKAVHHESDFAIEYKNLQNPADCQIVTGI